MSATLGSTFFVSLAFDILFYFIAGYCGIATVLFVLHSSAYRGNHLGTTIFNFYFIVCYKYLLLQSGVLFCGVAESGTTLWRPRTAGAYEYY